MKKEYVLSNLDLLNYLKISRKIFFNKHISKNRLSRFQDKLIRNQIKYIYDNSKFYRQKFDSANIKPPMIKGYSDLTKIPITTKEEVIENYQDMIIKKNKRHRVMTTSGSSGLTLTYRRYDSESFVRSLLSIRYLHAMGVRPFDRILFIQSGIKVKSFLFPLISLAKGYNLDYEKVHEGVDFIKKHKINCVLGSPSMLDILGNDYNKRKSDHKLKLLVSFAELLGETRRKKIESLFKSPVFDVYALKELPQIGFECKKREGLHINSDIVALECIKNGQQVTNEEGNLIATDLFNKYAPLIRYETSDTGIIKKDLCSCGCNFPLIDKIKGKTNDFIMDAKGNKISPTMIIYIMDKFKSISEYCIVQKSLKNIEIQIVPNQIYNKSSEKKLIEEFRKILPGIKINIAYKDHIPKYGDSGKTRFIIQKIKN